MDRAYEGLTSEQFMDRLIDKLSHLPRDEQRKAEAAISRYLESLETHQQSQPRAHAPQAEDDKSS